MKVGVLKMKSLKIYQVDVFAEKVFKGNPAAVCILDEKIEAELMQAIACEMNLSETAFLIPYKGDIKSNEFQIRWFTPISEVSLCGHATLAASEVLFNHIKIPFKEILFYSKSGLLKAHNDIYGISLDFPIDDPINIPSSKYNHKELLKAMGISKCLNTFYGKETKKLVIHLESQREVLEITPNYEQMLALDMDWIRGVGVTAPMGDGYDFITRYFNPWAGVNEDPVTGSVHTLLAAYWSDILGKKELRAYQASQRGGEMILRIKENHRLAIIGKAKLVLKGELYI